MLTFDHPRNIREGRKGRTIVIDVGPDIMGWTGRAGLADLLEVMGLYIDYAKIWALNAATMPNSFIRDTVGQYKRAGIETFAGGLLFEYAFLKNEVDGMVDLLKHLNIDGVEISENYLALSHDERLREVDRLTRNSLEVVFEFGRKQPETPMSPDELEGIVGDVIAAGAHHVIVEQSEFDLLDAQDPSAVDTMVAEKWFENVFVEADPFRFPKQHAELITRFGPEVNLANIAPGQVLRVENFRRGLGRAIDFPLIREALSEPHSSLT
ncbi:MAG: phosphosulfolactate synthase [Rhodospirillales bacterium]|nr:phosphosulfolactate synthase [Rhodospirillales bacterium]